MTQEEPSKGRIASQLYNLYDPTFHFADPKARSWHGDTWLVLAEQDYDFDPAVFWEVVERWILEAHLVIPPIEKTEIVLRKEEDDETVRHDAIVSTLSETIVRQVVPKRKDKDRVIHERIEYWDRSSGEVPCVVYWPLEPDGTPCRSLPYYYPKVKAFRYALEGSPDQPTLSLAVLPLHTPLDATTRMSFTAVFHKFYKWSVATSLGIRKRILHDQVVPHDIYTAHYTRLKERYAADLVRVWPEKTDPAKYIFEELAITAFILALWQLLDETKVRFADLGCGNGLVTYLLTAEGHQGFGVDIAARKVWDTYRHVLHCPVDLRAETLLPKEARYLDTQWLIANHADELVPWSVNAILAFISAYSPLGYPSWRPGPLPPAGKFLMIPCCAFDLTGLRYQVPTYTTHVPRHERYADYCKQLAHQYGFATVTERLRIPSTRNLGIVGFRGPVPEAWNGLVEQGAEEPCPLDLEGITFTPRSS